MRTFLTVFIAAGLPLTVLASDDASPASPPVSILLGSRHGHATPVRQGFTHTGGGNIDVAQPSSDTIVVTMTGVSVAGGHPCRASAATMNFDLKQCFEVVCNQPEIMRAKLALEGRVIGLLRSHCKGGGSAQQGPGTAAVTCGPVEVVVLTVPPHAVAGGENLSVNCRQGPIEVPIAMGTYILHQNFAVWATHPRSVLPCKAASAECAPDPALDPLWISHKEPFRGAAKEEFGFQIILKVSPEANAK